MIYLDNAATTFPKPNTVIDSMSDFMRTTMANPGRSGHKMSTQTNKMILETRMKLAKVIGAKNPLQIAFTKNASEALNMAIMGLLKQGDHVVSSMMEHNSVIRPLYKLKNDEVIGLSIVKGDQEGFIHWEEIAREIKPNTALVAITHSSNLLGSINDIQHIGNQIAALNKEREEPILFLVDCAQTVGAVPIDVEKMGIDLLAGAGHKSLYGPTGTGFLYVDEEVDLRAVYRGGTGSNSESPNQPEFMPDMLETGTLNAVGIVGMNAGIDYLQTLGEDYVLKHFHDLVFETIRQLESIQGIKIYGTKDAGRRTAVVCFNIEDMDSQAVTQRLSEEFDIATRGGMHCAPLAHNRMGTSEQGMVRVSFSTFNTMKDVDSLIQAVRKIKNELKSE